MLAMKETFHILTVIWILRGSLKSLEVRIVEIPKYRMVLSNYFYDLSEILRSFDKWFYEYNEK